VIDAPQANIGRLMLREFVHDGVTWTVWATYPSGGAVAVVAGFEVGWITFESDIGKRRLSPIPPGWEEFTEEQLWECFHRAIPAPSSRQGIRPGRAE
jgi:hypothetical protein